MLAAEEIFAKMTYYNRNNSMVLGVSFYEIYCDKAYDLLNEREKCPIRVDAKDNVNVVGLSEKIVSSP